MKNSKIVLYQKLSFSLLEGMSSMNLLQKKVFILKAGKREYSTHGQLMCVNVHWVIAFLVGACIYSSSSKALLFRSLKDHGSIKNSRIHFDLL